MRGRRKYSIALSFRTEERVAWYEGGEQKQWTDMHWVARRLQLQKVLIHRTTIVGNGIIHVNLVHASGFALGFGTKGLQCLLEHSCC